MATRPRVVDWRQLLLGGLVVWLSGLTLTFGLLRDLSWVGKVAVSVVVSLTVAPASMYLLNIFLGVPVTPANAILLFLLWAAVGAALWARPALTRLAG